MCHAEPNTEPADIMSQLLNLEPKTEPTETDHKPITESEADAEPTETDHEPTDLTPKTEPKTDPEVQNT